MAKHEADATSNINSLHIILVVALVIILLMLVGCVGFFIYGKKTVDKLKFIEDTSFAYSNASGSLASNGSPGKNNRFKFSTDNDNL